MIFKEEMVRGRERVTTDEERVYCEEDKVAKIARLSSCKNFVSEREKFIFDAFVDLQPVERFENACTISASTAVNLVSVAIVSLSVSRLSLFPVLNLLLLQIAVTIFP